jgi:hypothetical protein
MRFVVASGMAARERVVFTAIVGGYDEPKRVAVVDDDTDYICYSDDPHLNPPAPWVLRPLVTTQRSPRVTARWHKLLPHRHLAEYRYSFWIDGNFEITASLSEFFAELIAMARFAAAPHPFTDCVFAEAEEVKRQGLDDPDIVDLQMECYRRCEFSMPIGLIHSAVLFRAHCDPLVATAMEEWWQQVRLFSQRDQLSANYVFWKHDLPVDLFPFGLPENPYFRWYPHPVMKPRQNEIATDETDWLRRALIEARTALRVSHDAARRPARAVWRLW